MYRQTLLIITEHPPNSYSPSGERIFHTALASGSFFENVIVLSLCGVRKLDSNRQRGQGAGSGVWVYAVNFVRAMLYPLSKLFDPVKFLVLFVHGLLLSRRYKPSCILASMPPFETGMSAWGISKCLPSVFIMDLRDDWESAVGNELGRYFPAAVFNVLSLITNKIYSSAFVIFAATQTIIDTVRRRGVTTQTVLVPNGADTSVFLPKSESARRNIRLKYSLPQDKVVAVYCGSGKTPYYRLDYVLSSVKFLSSDVKNRIFVVLYVYDGSDKLKLMQNKLGITQDILEIRDPLPRKSLAEVLSACDLGLLPFAEDAFLLCARSTKLYEYLSSGLYVLSSGPKGGELEEFFSVDPALGLFVRPGAENFALYLSDLLKDKEDLLSDDLRKLRHSFIRENYDRTDIMKKAMNFLIERVQSNNKVNCIRNPNKV